MNWTKKTEEKTKAQGNTLKYKLLISDYDGTLAEGESVPKKTAEAIRKFQKAGGKFALCSGRSTLSAEKLMRENGILPDAMVTFQGATVKAEGKILKDDGVDADYIAKIGLDILSRGFTFGENRGAEFAAYYKDVLYYDGDSPETAFYVGLYPAKTQRVKSVPAFLEGKEGVVKKMNVIIPATADVAELHAMIAEKYGDKVTSNEGSPILEEIIGKHSTKIDGCRLIAQALGVEEEQTVTMGDSSNDEPLLKFGYGIAVGNAIESLKKIAKRVAPPVSDYPVKTVIEEILADAL